MRYKENGGVDAATLGEGYAFLPDETPYSGENIMNPAHIEGEREMQKLAKKYGWDEEEEVGFLDRKGACYRPGRSSAEDRG